MLILNIKEKGLYIEFPNYKPFRTPAKVDISGLDLTKVLVYLKANNISKYEIISSLDDEIDKNDIVKPISSEIKAIRELKELIAEDKEQIKNRLDRIERMIQGLKVIEGSVKSVTPEIKQSYDQDEEEEEISFIPNVDLSGFSSSNKFDSVTLTTRGDINENVELLQKLKNKK